MTPLVRSSLVLTLAASGLVVWGSSRDEVGTVSATGMGLFEDTDADLLPDALEWVLMSDPTQVDSDGDGIEDFLEATQFAPLLQRGSQMPMDNELRAAVYGVTAPDGTSHVMLSLMVRVVQSGPISIRPFVDYQGQRFDISQMFWSLVADAKLRANPSEGTFAIASAWLGPAHQVLPLLPLSIGVDGSIGGRSFSNGSLLIDASGTVATLVTPSWQSGLVTAFAVQPIDGQDPEVTNRGGFWQSSKTCLLSLVPAGGSANEIADASCTGSPTLLCAPNCSSMKGGVIVVPSGLPFLTGN
jgi:hypothetical protein